MKACVLIVLVFASFALGAETIYKSVDANGGVIYSDAPIAGANVVGRFQTPSMGAPGPGAGSGDVALAERALASAERALNLGRDPLPHERVAGGAGRLSAAYFERVLALERAVDEARVRLRQEVTRYQY
jgi:hypothetical protein